MTRSRRGGRRKPGSRGDDIGQAHDIDGVIVVDKPGGMSSAQVVARVKRALGARRAGHTGTLDPMATGVLLVCLGKATKLAEYLLADDKGYEGELELGVETDTLDSEGHETRRREREAADVGQAALAEAMATFVGTAEQVPPMYSALKHGGKPLYELARAGETVERRPRSVRIDRFALLEYHPPRARFAVDCSKGTYVRSLVADLGQRLGCGAHLTQLRRVRSGDFGIDESMQLSDISEKTYRAALIEPARAVAHMPAFTVAEAMMPAVSSGQRVRWSALAGSAPQPSGICRLLDPDGGLLALARVEQGRLRFERVFAVRA